MLQGSTIIDQKLFYSVLGDSMRSLIGLKNVIIFSAVLLTVGSVSAQQAFAGSIPQCNSSEYLDANKCLPLTECTDDEFESTPPTANSDRVCSTLPSIPIGGTVGSMGTVSLLVAGAQGSMGWWSLALVGMVAAGAAITYKLKSKKTEQ